MTPMTCRIAFRGPTMKLLGCYLRSPHIKPMTVFIAVLLSSNVDEFDVVCILPSKGWKCVLSNCMWGYVTCIQIPCEALHENKIYIYIHW
jgi:hypothetical protein